MSILTHRIAEPLLEFGHGQQMEAPKDGLFLFGPLEGPDAAPGVRLGVIGTESGVGLSRRWLERISLHIPGKVGVSGISCAGGRLNITPPWP
jgi:hypothetical protein